MLVLGALVSLLGALGPNDVFFATLGRSWDAHGRRWAGPGVLGPRLLTGPPPRRPPKALLGRQGVARKP